MRLIALLEQRFDRTPDGIVWTHSGFSHSFWARYLEIFDEVRVVARVREVEAIVSDAKTASGQRVTFAPVPHYIGLAQYLQRLPVVRCTVRSAIRADDAVILRVPSQLANVVAPMLHSVGHPYGVEVVGDPYDVFAPGAVRHPFRPFFRWWFSRNLKAQCAKACAAAYVTEHALQRRYPADPSAFTTSYSSVELSDESFATSARPAREIGKEATLITVGSLAQLYKGTDMLIDAVAELTREGLAIRLVVVGDGKHRGELEQRAATAGLDRCVEFLGQLPAGEAVRAQLDQADLFVLPSRTEGLPRAMIEGMARGLPCIGTHVGGIPELLTAEDLVPVNDAAALARKIDDVLSNPQRMHAMSERNLAIARSYHTDALHDRRQEFYWYVRHITEAWVTSRSAHSAPCDPRSASNHISSGDMSQ